MTISSRLLAVVLPVVLLGACASLSDQDKASLAAANQKADQAMATAQQANATAQQANVTAQQALDAAKAAQASAAQAAASAQSANEKADRIFQRSLRK